MTNSPSKPQTPDKRSGHDNPSLMERPNRLAMETKMASRLQDGIDEQGRYAPRLKDLSIGYAAAKGVSEIEARKEIASIFHSQIGMSPQSYLEQNRAERGLPNDQRSNDQSRGR